MAKRQENRRQLTAFFDLSEGNPPAEIIREINRLINARLAVGRSQRKVIKHSLEAGLIAENVFRKTLRETLPLRYGVAKGKAVNGSGKLSCHLDVIIYDALNYPSLFIDDNQNQILPIEGIYAVVEVKSSTTKSILEEAFVELSSVQSIHPGTICSANDLVDHRPPILAIFSFDDARSLETLHKNFVELNSRHPRSFSSSSYSSKSPGSKESTGEHYMVHSVSVAGKGQVYHMLNGETAVGRWGDYTAGMMIYSLLHNLQQIVLKPHNPFSYLSWMNAGRRETYGPGKLNGQPYELNPEPKD